MDFLRLWDLRRGKIGNIIMKQKNKCDKVTFRLHQNEAVAVV